MAKHTAQFTTDSTDNDTSVAPGEELLGYHNNNNCQLMTLTIDNE